MYDCFYMTNIAPEAPILNRVTGEGLEAYCRTIARDSEVWIVTGTIPGNTVIGDGINVPRHWYKSILSRDIKTGALRAGAWLFVNSDNNLGFKSNTTTVDNLEIKTQKDFWPLITDEKLESITWSY